MRLVLVSLVLALAAPSALASPARPGRATSLAIIGDTPYGAAQLAYFPRLRAAIDADPAVRTVVHLGDIKSGSSPCTDAYLAQVADLFAGFTHPLVYTPGDNEWTDCHRTKAGKYDPLERLAAVRDVFFAQPGLLLGGAWPRFALSQAWWPGGAEFPENMLWRESDVVFVTIHVVGSNNDLVPWFTDDATDDLEDDAPRRDSEWRRRTVANVTWLGVAFAAAELTHARGVVVAMQADMWDGTPVDGFAPVVQALATRSAHFARPVLLLNGDSHAFTVDHPLASGSPLHGVTTAAPNLTRLTVQGAESAHEYLRLTVDPDLADVFSWMRVSVAE